MHNACFSIKPINLVIMNRKKILQSILVLGCIATFMVSCQDEENEMKQGIGDDQRPEWTGIKMCTDDKDYCLNPRTAHTKMVALKRGSFQNSPATKVRNMFLFVTNFLK